jgi:hypothetical protein
MAISRPFLLALLGAVLLGASFFAVQNARDAATEGAEPMIPASQPQATQQVASRTPQQTLESAFSADKLTSAKFDATLTVRSRGESGTFGMSGAFESRGPDSMPALDVELQARTPGQQDLEVGFVSTSDRAWLVDGDSAYRVPQEAWDQIVEARQKGAGSQQQLPLPVNPMNWLRDLKSEAGEDIDGVETQHLSASFDAQAAMHDLLKVAEQSGDATAGVFPPGAEERIDEFVKEASLDVYVGKDDGLLRRLTADLELAIPGSGQMDIDFTADLTNVDEPQRIGPPSKVESGLPGGTVGQFSRTVLSGAAVTAGADPTAVTASTTTGPRRFRRALAEKRKVVLFFSQGAADDKATAEAVRALKRKGKLLVVQDDVEHVDAYGKLVEQLGIYQAPAIVIVGRSGNARLLEGYVDAGVLAQEVADAR